MIRDVDSYDWFTISLILVGLGLVFLKLLNKPKYNKYFQLLYTKTYFKAKLKETRYISLFENIAFILANIVAAQLVYIFMMEKEAPELFFSEALLNLLSVFMIISLFFFIKYHFEKLINFCYHNHEFLNMYLFFKQVIWSYAVFLSLPFLIFFIYFPDSNINFLYVTLGVSAVYFIINIFYFLYKNRSFAIRNWYYFILYLCALEIAPYYFLYNLFVIE